ncbi:hypothetical protein WJN01_12760 [Flavobacteriaceae bacterium SZ-1-7]|uniref:hypothetical protein n=1 Tax=Tamlana sedimenti TaxID=3134126 RepID=UPI003127D755
MLSDKQSLILSGIMAIGIFVFGILDILDNFVVLTLMTIAFFTIILNLLYLSSKSEEEPQEQELDE